MGELVLRPYDMKRDLEGMYDLAEAAYVEDYGRIGVSVKAGMAQERRVVAVVSFVSRFIPALRDISPGYVWVDNGKIVSFVHFARRGFAGDRWSIETVMTHPGYQRRGLARKLVEAATQAIRARGGRVCVLKVRADNAPAYALYRSLGFAHCDTTVHMRAQSAAPASSVRPPGGTALRRVLQKEWHRTWRARYDLAQREAPSDVCKFLPVSEHEYRRPWFVRLLGPGLARLSGRHIERWHVKDGEGLLATLSIGGDADGKGTHDIQIHLDPAHEATLAPLVVERSLASLAALPPCPVLCETRASNEALLAALRARGFSEMAVWHTLALRLDAT